MAAVERIVRIELKVLEKRLALSHSVGERAATFGGSWLLGGSVEEAVLIWFGVEDYFKFIIAQRFSFGRCSS